ncbi:ROK family protein [Streptomyces alanosinicus]|uniref:ROK family protein n=1 Tax=Streptomyces alanosinicus TaxID=68171 RepID=A0A919D865_9ACTN|nr:ROK family protein [Streptomyces alanosinicus]GHE12576.1 hypothetical protein GCM10010339_76330 [Streptomyces alanosinicus]
MLRRGAAADDGPYRELLERFANGFAIGLATISAVLDPGAVVLVGHLVHAGGEPLLRLLEAETEELAAVDVPLALAEIVSQPVLRGALEGALTAARDDLSTTSQ